MASQTKSAGLGTDAGGGAVAWTNPNGIATGGSAAASIDDAGNSPTSSLDATNFGFTLPDNAIVQGIEVDWDTTTSQNNSTYGEVSLRGAGGASDNKGAGNAWVTSNPIAFGGIADLWGLSPPSPALINASAFGSRISGAIVALTDNLGVGGCQIIVTYDDTQVHGSGSLGISAFTAHGTGKSFRKGTGTLALGSLAASGSGRFHAASSQTRTPPSPATSNGDGTGGVAWSNAGAFASGGGASADMDNASLTPTELLEVTQLGFTLPGNATLKGVAITVGVVSSNGTIYDQSIVLLGCTLAGDNKANGIAWPAAVLVNKTFGSASDLWNAGPTLSQVNSTAFGFGVSAQCTSASDTASMLGYSVTITFDAWTFRGTGALSIAPMSVHGTGHSSTVVSVTGSPAIPAASIAGTGKVWRKATGSPAFAAVTLAGSGHTSRNATGSLAMPGMSLSGSGLLARGGHGTLALGSMAIAGAGEIRHRRGTGSLLLGSFATAGTAHVVLPNYRGFSAVASQFYAPGSVRTVIKQGVI